MNTIEIEEKHFKNKKTMNEIFKKPCPKMHYFKC